jgi:hypothetical protein
MVSQRIDTFALMLSRAETRKISQDFWTSFGVFMRKHPHTHHHKSKWLNYRTGVKDVYFRLEADKEEARICIDIQHNDAGIRELYYEQFTELRNVLHDAIGMEMIWIPRFTHPSTGKQMSRLYLEKTGLNMFNRADWGPLFLFFEGHYVALDEFWSDFKGVFDALS